VSDNGVLVEVGVGRVVSRSGSMTSAALLRRSPLVVRVGRVVSGSMTPGMLLRRLPLVSTVVADEARGGVVEGEEINGFLTPSTLQKF